MLHIFGIIAGILSLSAVIPYIWDTIKGSTRPNIATWLIWVALLVVALLSQISGGGTDSLLLTIGDLLGSSLILFFALYKGENKWHWLDKVALVGAAIGFIALFIFHQPLIALLITILIDICGLVPTFRKAFIDPDSETLSTWLMVGIGAIFGALAVGDWSLVLLIYPIYLAAANLGVGVAMGLGKLHKKSVDIELRQ